MKLRAQTGNQVQEREQMIGRGGMELTAPTPGGEAGVIRQGFRNAADDNNGWKQSWNTRSADDPERFIIWLVITYTHSLQSDPPSPLKKKRRGAAGGGVVNAGCSRVYAN